MSESVTPKRMWGGLQWCAVIVVSCLFAFGILMPISDVIYDDAAQSSSMYNAHEIIIAMKIYAEDHDGVYPDSKCPEDATSNQVFRELFREEILIDERIFGARFSRFVPDGNIGNKPDFTAAVAAGENHWALVAGQGRKTAGYYPLVLEKTPLIPPGRRSGIRSWRCNRYGGALGGRTRSLWDSVTTVWNW